MLKEPHREKRLLLFHTIVCYFLVNDKVGGGGLGKKWQRVTGVVVNLRPGTLLKRDSNTGVFPLIVVTFLRTSVFKNICERLLLTLFLDYCTNVKVQHLLLCFGWTKHVKLMLLLLLVLRKQISVKFGSLVFLF